MTRGIASIAPAALMAALAFGGCGNRGAAGSSSTGSGDIARPKASSAVPVVIGTVERTSFPVQVHAIGTGQAFKTVSVESQVAGVVKDVHYRPGQLLHKGDLLATLDESLFRAALAQAQSALARDQAQEKLSQVELNRDQTLRKKGIIPNEQLDQAVATSSAAAATVSADQAAIQTARIQLSYCSVVAPIGGVAGAQLVYPGTAVKANDLPALVVINQVSPIYVNFSVPQQYLDSIEGLMAHDRLRVEATPPGGTTPERGVLTFINNAVDPTTGTIQLMASFPNADRHLWPGQFSDVLLQLNELANVLVLPSQAVQTGQQGDYVFVVKPDMTVGVQPVKAGQTVNGKTEILNGLSAGETVVTDGQVRLVAGAKVYVASGAGVLP